MKPTKNTAEHAPARTGIGRRALEKRATINAAGLRHSLQSALALKTRKSKLEAILLAFIAPVVDRSMRGGTGWKNYIRLMAQIANLSQRETFVSAVPEHYEGIVRAFIHSIKSLYPRMNDA